MDEKGRREGGESGKGGRAECTLMFGEKMVGTKDHF